MGAFKCGARLRLLSRAPDASSRSRLSSAGAVAGPIDFGRADLRERGIELRGGAADEAPDAYKRLDEVLADHGDSIRVLHRLTPIGVAMAGADTFDPYKD